MSIDELFDRHHYDIIGNVTNTYFDNMIVSFYDDNRLPSYDTLKVIERLSTGTYSHAGDSGLSFIDYFSYT